MPAKAALSSLACLLAAAFFAGPAFPAARTAEAQVTPTVFTTIRDSFGNPVTSVLSGTIVHDTASTSSLFGPPSGSVSFTWYENGTCDTGTGTPAGAAATNGTGLADGSTPQGPLAPGDYSFSAHFTSFNSGLWTDAEGDACEPLHVVAAPVFPLTGTKNATPSYARSYTWGITKSVDGPTSQTIPAGGSATFDYTVAVTHDDGTDSDWQVSGQIKVANQNTAPVDGVSVSDSVDDPNATCIVSGGSSTLPATSTTAFDYTCTYSTAPAGSNQTNTATISWPDQTLSNFSDLPGASTPAVASFAWGAPTSISNGSVDVGDSQVGLLDSLFASDPSPPPYTYSATFTDVPVGTCTDYDNTAHVNNDALVLASTDATVEVCSEGTGEDLTVTKTALPSFTRTFGWDVAKSVDRTSASVPDGTAATFNYAVDVIKGPAVDSGWNVTGEITVGNDNGWDIDAILADEAPGGSCTLAQTNVTVPANSSISIPYACTFTSGDPGVNTATVTWDPAVANTPTGSASGTAGYAFTTPTDVVHDTVDVLDNGVLLGTTDHSAHFAYAKDLTGIAGTCASHDNTATVESGGAPIAPPSTVTVKTCVGSDPTVTKTATTSFTRTYKWKIAKSVAAPSTVTQAAGTAAAFNYTVTVAGDGSVDSDWAVTGMITVSNPNDWEALTTTVTDAVDNGGVCTVTNGTGVVVPAGGSASRSYRCTYAAPPSPAGGANTATATWDNGALSTPHASATGTAGFAFGAPTTERTTSVTATDTFNGSTSTLGTVTFPGSGTFAYTRTVTVPGTGCATYPNTAKLVETGQSASASVIVCAAAAPGPVQSGALTIGYWQNKNGQGIVAAANQAQLLAFLRGYAPFADASAPLTTYATNVIKAASGSTMNSMLKAQMLATALNVYFSSPALGGNKIGAAGPIGGIVIDLTHVQPIGDTSPAFGGATSMTIAQTLAYAAGRSNAGGSVWYGNVKGNQELAKDVFDAVNNQWILPG